MFVETEHTPGLALAVTLREMLVMSRSISLCIRCGIINNLHCNHMLELVHSVVEMQSLYALLLSDIYLLSRHLIKINGCYDFFPNA